MNHLNRSDLLTLEDYAEQRPEMRQRVMEHKRHRKLAIGPNATLYFEDRLTIQYQIQEMLRAERIFEASGIQEELDAYNPLIPDGTNWKATFMLEYPDKDERARALAQLVGIEDRVWVQIPEFERVYAIADEDMDRETEEKTSSVHFLRFELSKDMIDSVVVHNTDIFCGIDHANYEHQVAPVPEPTRESLCHDLRVLH